ncbi:transcription factor TCP7 [Trifolium repens]|nr:transcription factor TCP7 [Trifolium repens]
MLKKTLFLLLLFPHKQRFERYLHGQILDKFGASLSRLLVLFSSKWSFSLCLNNGNNIKLLSSFIIIGNNKLWVKLQLLELEIIWSFEFACFVVWCVRTMQCNK